MNAEEYNQIVKERREAREEANPEIRLRREQMEREREERVARLRSEQEPMLAELREVGCVAQGIYDFVNYGGSYPEALPILLKHLQKIPPYSDTILAGIIRSLTVKELRGKFNKLALQMYRDDTREPVANGVRWCLANALSVVAELDDVDEMIELLRDQRNGPARSPFLDALVRFVGKRPEIVEVFDSVKDDPELSVRVQTRQILKRKAVAKAREELVRRRDISS